MNASPDDCTICASRFGFRAFVGLAVCVVGCARSAAVLPWAPLPYDLYPDGYVSLKSPDDFSKRREALIRLIWGSSGFPSSKLPTKITKGVNSPIGPHGNLNRVDQLLINMESEEYSIAHHFISMTAKNRLVIVHQGHSCTLGDNAGGTADVGMVNAVNVLLTEGYSVLVMYLPRYQPPPGRCDNKLHNDFFQTVKVSDGNPVKFFLEPVAVSLNYLSTQNANDGFPKYLGYDMMGLSGGGWTTTLYAALDPRIQISVPIAGTVPLYMRKCWTGYCRCDSGCAPANPTNPPKKCTFGFPPRDCNFGYDGDAEQTLPALYQGVAGYLDLYALGAQGAHRRQIQVLNRRDSCCFGAAHFAGPGGKRDDPTTWEAAWEKDLRDYEKLINVALTSTNGGSFQLVIDEAAKKHEVSRSVMTNTVLPALGNR